MRSSPPAKQKAPQRGGRWCGVKNILHGVGGFARMRGMQTSQILKNLSRAHYLYRRAVPGSADKDTQRTHIAIYQRLYHAATGSWPEMPLINASIRRYETEFWQNYIRQKAIESSRAARTITNSGPGGPNCRASSAETCRCKGRTVDLTPEISAALSSAGFTQEEIQRLDNKLPACDALTPGKERKEAEEKLESMSGVIQTNAASGIKGTVSKDSVGKIVSRNALGESFRNLVDSGFCDKDTAFRIHMSAASNIDNLFTAAPKIEHQTVYHYEESREAATHLYCPFHVPGISAPLTADISVILFKGDSNQRIYSLGLRVKPPLPTSGISQ